MSLHDIGSSEPAICVSERLILFNLTPLWCLLACIYVVVYLLGLTMNSAVIKHNNLTHLPDVLVNNHNLQRSFLCTKYSHLHFHISICSQAQAPQRKLGLTNSNPDLVNDEK
jgi:hypothetical protein